MKDLYDRVLRAYWLPSSITYKKHADSQKLAVIVDPRYDTLMLSVINLLKSILRKK